MTAEYDDMEADRLRADDRIARRARWSYCGHCDLAGTHRIGCPNATGQSSTPEEAQEESPTENPLSLTQELLMKHGVLSAARSFAAMESSAVLEIGGDFRITVRLPVLPEMPARNYVRWFPTPADAALAAVAEERDGALADYAPAPMRIEAAIWGN